MTVVPRRAWRKAASPSIEPSASGSGLTWQASATDGARASTSAARPSSSIVVTARGFDLAKELVHPFHLLQANVLFEVELRRELEANLVPEHGPQVRASGLEAGSCPAEVLVLAEHRVVDRRATQVGRDLDARDRDEPDPRVLQPRDLLGEDLTELLGHAFGSPSPAHVASFAFSRPARAETGRSR